MAQSTSSQSLLTDEQQESTPVIKKKFPCDRCDRSFSRKDTLVNHIRTHTGEKLFSCAHCRKKFTRKQYLSSHIRKQTDGGPYQCDECGEYFVAKCVLKQHEKAHTGPKLHKCTQCEKTFPRKGNFNRHMLIHTGENAFKCSYCKKPFNRSDALKHHEQRVHKKVNQYQCNHCKRSFSTLERYKRHQKILHTNLRRLNVDHSRPEMIQSFDSKLQNFASVISEKHKCDKCSLLFLFMSGLKRHYTSHLRTNPQIFGHGQKVMKRLRIWRYHSHKHKGLLRKLLLRYRTFNWNSAPMTNPNRAFYRCVLCTRSFYRPSQFINHMQRHKDEEPIKYRVSSRIFEENPI